MRFQRSASALALAVATLLPHAVIPAQVVVQPRVDSLPPRPQAAPAPVLPFEFSGVLFANFQSGGTRTERQARLQNRFDVERAYLTFRAPAGDRMSIRITTDLYQQRDSTRDQYFRGWALRAKYAYAQYDYVPGTANALKAVARLGMLHTAIIDHEETFWPRGIANSAVEQQGYFSSSDVGASTLITLPRKMGEIYGVIVNGAGYTSRETDRFKDVGGRVTLTPFSNGHSILRTLAVTPWMMKGNTASAYIRKRGTVLATNEGRQKDRYGAHVGIKDPRVMLASQFAWRTDAVETADTTRDTAPTVTSRTGRTISSYAIVKPLSFFEALPAWPINVMLRLDHTRPDTKAEPTVSQVIAGLGWDLNKKAILWVDFQNQDPKNNSTAADIKTLFVHAIVTF